MPRRIIHSRNYKIPEPAEVAETAEKVSPGAAATLAEAAATEIASHVRRRTKPSDSESVIQADIEETVKKFCFSRANSNNIVHRQAAYLAAEKVKRNLQHQGDKPANYTPLDIQVMAEAELRNNPDLFDLAQRQIRNSEELIAELGSGDS